MQGALVTSRGRLPEDLGTPRCGAQWGGENWGRGVVSSVRDRKQFRRIGEAIPGGRRRPDGTLVFF